MEGTIRRTIEEMVYLQLDFDQEERADHPWFWAPETNTLCYCMPEPGTKAVLYLPSQKEAEGRVVLATVKNLQNGIYNDTQKREFVTGCHKKLGLYPQKIFVENVDGSVTCSMDDNSGITIGSNTGISFLADGEISCTGRNITIMTPVKAVSRTAQSNRDGWKSGKACRGKRRKTAEGTGDGTLADIFLSDCGSSADGFRTNRRSRGCH